MLAHSLGAHERDADGPALFAVALERTVWCNHALQRDVYCRRVRQLHRHLSADPRRFRALEPAFVATMDARELCGSAAADDADEDALPQALLDSTANDAERVRSEVQCRGCKRNRVTYYQRQTRSADEPPTTFYRCEYCGREWKSSS